MGFLNNLTALMEMYGMNRTEFAKAIGTSPSTVNSWYNRSYENISLKTLLKITSFFDITLEELINNADYDRIVFTVKDYTKDELIMIKKFGIFLKQNRKEL